VTVLCAGRRDNENRSSLATYDNKVILFLFYKVETNDDPRDFKQLNMEKNNGLFT